MCWWLKWEGDGGNCFGGGSGKCVGIGICWIVVATLLLQAKTSPAPMASV